MSGESMLDTYVELDRRVDGAEGEGLRARWDFGHLMLCERNGQKKLPKGRRDEIAEAVGKGIAEVDRRAKFAERFPTEAELDHAVIQFGSWHRIVNEALASTAHLSAEKDEWETPADLFELLDEEFGFTRDVCASEENRKCAEFWTAADVPLMRAWDGVNWMNPPYSEAELWIAKAHAEGELGVVTVCLVPSRTDVGWFWEHARHGEIRFLKGRLHFTDDEGNTGPAPFPSCLVVFGCEPGVVFYDR